MKYLIRALRHPRDYRWRELRPWQAHSTVLAVAGGAHIALGIAFGFTAPTETRRAGLELGLKLMPFQAWGGLWIIVGAIALISARWPPASKTWGYTALSAMAWCWGALYGVGIPAVGVPVSIGGPALLIWWMFAVMWWGIAHLINPDDVEAHVHEIVNRTTTAEAEDS